MIALDLLGAAPPPAPPAPPPLTKGSVALLAGGVIGLVGLSALGWYVRVWIAGKALKASGVFK